MTSTDRHAQLLEQLKNAEKEAKNEESLFLVELVTAATHDATPGYDLSEVYEALKESQAWLLLDPLNLFPLLIPSDHPATPDIIRLISHEGHVKESVIAVQEAFERLKETIVSESDVAQHGVTKNSSQLLRLIEVCRDALPRLKLRKKTPGETLRPIFENLSEVIETISPFCDKNTGRMLVSSITKMMHSVLPWISQNSGEDEEEHKAGANLLTELLYSTLSACAPHIRANIAQRQFEASDPRLVIRSVVSPDSEYRFEVIKEAIDFSRALNITSEILATPPIRTGQLVLLAHGYNMYNPRLSTHLNKFLPIITSSVQQNIAVDESLALLLSFLSSSKEDLNEEIVKNLAILLTPLASTHPDPPTRLISFRILSSVLSRAPSPVHLAHLSSLVSDCPFPQMRVAAVGLVKDAFLDAIATDTKSPFASPSLIRALGPVLFRPNPTDLFSSLSQESLKKFIESSEPPRLTECLSFYYVLLKRDTKNLTGVKDRDVLKTVESSLIAPLRKALAKWLGDASSIQDPHTLMPLASLETSLERVESVLHDFVF